MSFSLEPLGDVFERDHGQLCELFTVLSNRCKTLVLGPVPRVLVQERQRRERAHPVEEQDAVEVVGLVLDDARLEILEGELDALALADSGRAG